MDKSQSAACIHCDKPHCKAEIIIASVEDQLKKVDYTRRRLQLTCPACHRVLSLLIASIICCLVTDEHLKRGFLKGAN